MNWKYRLAATSFGALGFAISHIDWWDWHPWAMLLCFAIGDGIREAGKAELTLKDVE